MGVGTLIELFEGILGLENRLTETKAAEDALTIATNALAAESTNRGDLDGTT